MKCSLQVIKCIAIANDITYLTYQFPYRPYRQIQTRSSGSYVIDVATFPRKSLPAFHVRTRSMEENSGEMKCIDIEASTLAQSNSKKTAAELV